ncbi:hypothetical protein AKJ09_09646 [Labilithrix luteola]|uniref:Uncharacterized protein n=1 Tax=Labilithrix luteola TaxID=1391654 RepID=A0A0K1QB74_9BACT|nr:hypothetical protein [Labilithrix luteola]AKV02983.1 hypothetical protein AKJ09_09646 [Labilithrix luteola]
MSAATAPAARWLWAGGFALVFVALADQRALPPSAWRSQALP